MDEHSSKFPRVNAGDAARESEAMVRSEGRATPRRIEGGTAARRSEAEERSSVKRSPYGMRISAHVGRPFTLEEERTGAGERMPQGHAPLAPQSIAMQRDVVLRPRVDVAEASTAAYEATQQISSREGKAEPEQQGRFEAGVSSLKALLPRSWFTS